jgi:hypothetical protein
MTSLVPSILTHYPEIRIRNHLVPWNLHALMASIFAFNRGSHYRPLIERFHQVLIFSSFIRIHSDFTLVPWESSTSMVISLDLANGSHQ